MGNYLDNTYAAIDGVLLSYRGDDVSLTIPGRLANMDIQKIGDGAFMLSQDLQQVIIPEKIEQIGKRAFYGCGNLSNVYVPYSVTSFGADAFGHCPKLSNIYIYGMPLSEQAYSDLKASSVCAGGSVYTANTFPDIITINNMISSIEAKKANYIQSGIQRLFFSQSLDEEKGAGSISRNLYGLDFKGGEKYMTETNAFLRLLADKSISEYDRFSEEKNDRFLRSEDYPFIRKTAIFTFDDSKTKLQNGRYNIFADIKIGYIFWQSKVPVFLSGKTYYIYRRHYLSHEPNLNYIRRDVAVFTNKGVVTDRGEAQNVYAKYKLLSML